MSGNQATSGSTNAAHVIIIGAGIGGIMSAIALKKQLSFTNFTIFEQSDDLAGTWHLTNYPGCASDVATHLYSYSGELNPDWEQTHVEQPQLKKYWKGVADKYSITSHIRFLTRVLGAEWLTKEQQWSVQVQDVRTGEVRTEFANAVIAALGMHRGPKYSDDLKGIRDKFKGKHFHSARWNHSVDLRNKRVAVIGNGCSASQFVPRITEDPTTQVISFCRTPNWVVFKFNESISAYTRWFFRTFPPLVRLYRWYLMAKYETDYYLFFRGGRNSLTRAIAMKVLTMYMKQATPKKYHDLLIPKYQLGCKRIVVNSGHLEALHRPNNDINFDGIAEVTETGILTRKGDHFEFDVVIEATGYVTDDFPIRVQGVKGTTIQEYFQSNGGPIAYMGVVYPGFPNFFTLSGPNTGTGHSSEVFSQEITIDYIVQLLDPVIKQHASSFEITAEATDRWNLNIQKRLSQSVWSTCRSWYRVDDTGRNFTIFPGSMMEMWWHLSKPVWSDYKAVNAEKWERNMTESRRRWSIGSMAWAFVLAASVFWFVAQYP